MKYFKISIVLCIISIACATAIALVNMLTSDIIDKNNEAVELNAAKEIFDEYDNEKSVILYETQVGDIQKVVKAMDSNGNELGYLYTVYGKNSYGAIRLLVAIKNETVYQIEFLENGQTVSNVLDHAKENYPMARDEKIEFNPWDKEEYVAIEPLDNESLANVDTKCGGTYGADVVKNLITLALNDSKEASKYE